MVEELVVAERHGACLVLRLNRPEAGNAISREVAEALGAHLRACTGAAMPKALVITGTGARYFCTGGDVKAYARLRSAEDLDTVFGLMREVCDALERLPCPVIAAINGFAIGGGAELALACDMRFAEASAQIGFPQSRLGVLPGWDGMQRLLDTVGRAAATRLLFTGKRVSAQEARELGLVDEVVPDGTVLRRALEMADTCAEVAPLAIGAIKLALKDAARAGTPQAVAETRVRTRESFARLWFTEDHAEAERAFAEKREPKFTGR